MGAALNIEGLEPRRMLAAAAGTINGFKFYDENANGAFDSAAESTTTAGAVFIDFNNNGVCDTGEPAVSDFSPTFSFTGLTPGTYTLRSAGTSHDVQPSDGPSTVAGAVKRITLPAGAGADGVAFGYTNRGGRATVDLFEDKNRNGTYGFNESGTTRGTAVYLDLNNDGKWQSSEPLAQGLADGTTSFYNLSPGTYVMRPLAGTNWVPASPGQSLKISINNTGGLTGGYFGFLPTDRPASLSGFAYADNNGDGAYDAGDAPAQLNEVAAYWDTNNNGQLDSSEPFGVSDDTGSFSLNVAAGPGQLRFQSGRSEKIKVTQPAVGYRTLTAVANKLTDVGVIGIAPLGGIAGTVYEDTDGNGVANPIVDKDVAGRVVLDEDHNGRFDSNEPSTTLVGGRYYLPDVPAGPHDVLILQSEYNYPEKSVVVAGLSTATLNFLLSHPVDPTDSRFIDAGGGAAGIYAADNSYSGGSTYKSSAAVSTSAITSPAPQAVYQTERYGNFSYNLDGLTAGKAYSFTLHFDELYWSAAGKRAFNVTGNGVAWLSSFDIYAAAGGKNKAITRTFTSTADSGGKIVIAFSGVKDNAKVNAIDVVEATTASAPKYINAGGAAVGVFAADNGYSGGKSYSSTAAIDTSGVSSPAPQAVYQTERYGNFAYTLANLVAGQQYTLSLDFEELYWTAAGQRVFNVAANGASLLINFDVFAAAGAKNRAIRKQFTVTADSAGNVAITFVSVKDNAKVSAIQVIPVPSSS